MPDKELSDQLDDLFSDIEPDDIEPDAVRDEDIMPDLEARLEAELMEEEQDEAIEVLSTLLEPAPAATPESTVSEQVVAEQVELSPAEPGGEQRVAGEPAAPPSGIPAWDATIMEQRARILNVLLVTLTGISSVIIVTLVIFGLQDPTLWQGYVPFFAGWAALLGLTLARQADPMARAAILVVLAYLVGINTLLVDGPLGAGWLYLLIAPVLLSVLVGRQVGAYAAVFSFSMYVILLVAHQQGWVEPVDVLQDLTQWDRVVNVSATFGMLLVTATLVQWMFNATVTTALREAEEKHTAAVGAQQTMRERADELATANEMLQQRTLQLQTAAQVSQATTRLLDPDELVEQVVSLIRRQFGLYYVALFLVDERSIGARGGIVGEEWAVLRADAGEVVHPVLTPGYSLQVGGTSAVGRCMANAQPHIALDVEQTPLRADEALLPETRSHIALPLRSRGRVIGALDVQSAQANAFSDEDIAALQTMADQIATAIDNAQLFMALRERLEEMEADQRRQARGRWADFALQDVAPTYERAQPGIPSLDEALPLGVDEAMLVQDTVVRSDERGDSRQAALMTPIRLRDQVIGTLGLQEMSGRQWTSDEIALIEAVADQMALAIENARLIAETQRRAEREQALGQIGDLFNRSLDVETLLQTAVRELGQLLEVEEVAVQLQAPAIEGVASDESD